MRIALVHDYLNQYGGAERVLEEFLEIFPDAPIYTLLYDQKKLPPSLKNKLKGRKKITSSLQSLPGAKKHHKFYLWAMPYLVEQWDFSDYEIVLSDSASFAKGLICPPGIKHICYCHTPLRYAWGQTHQYQKEYPFPYIIKRAIPPALHYIRIWDRQAAQRPEKLLCNSRFIKKRIKKYYKRDARLLHPPVETQKLINQKTEKGNFFLIVSRLIPYKKVGLAVDAFNQLGWPLKIIGEGPEYKKIKEKAKGNIELLGSVYGKELTRYYKKAKGFVLPQKEDFGIAPIEAMACGKPVIAYKGGGALDYIQEDTNGIFFKNQTSEDLKRALQTFQNKSFDSFEIKKSVSKFDKSIFRDKIKEVVANYR